MQLPVGQTDCYFSVVNRFTTADFSLIKHMIVDKVLNGWKVGLEQDMKTKEYTLYWGA
jgi:hypothetical protein